MDDPREDEEMLRTRLHNNDPSLTSLTLDGDQINKEVDAEDWVTALSGNTFLQELTVRNHHVNITTTTSSLVAKILFSGGGANLKALRLENVGLTVQSFKGSHSSSTHHGHNSSKEAATSRQQQQHHHYHHLQELSLANNPKLGPRGCQELRGLLQQRFPHLLVLNLPNVGMGHYGVQGMDFPLYLQALNLSQNQLGIDGIWKLNIAPLQYLRQLDLSDNGIADDGCMELTKILPHLSSLHSLKLSSNGIGDTGLAALAQAMRESHCVQELYLADNRIERVDALAELLLAQRRRYPQPKRRRRHAASGKDDNVVDKADDDGIEDADDDNAQDSSSSSTSGLEMTHQSGAPPSSSSLLLRRLDLSHNRLDSTACLQLAESLKSNTTLQSLDLSYNQIDDEGAGGFVDIVDISSSTSTTTHHNNDHPIGPNNHNNDGLRELILTGNHAISAARQRILEMLLKHRCSQRALILQPPTVMMMDDSSSSTTTRSTSSKRGTTPAVAPPPPPVMSSSRRNGMARRMIVATEQESSAHLATNDDDDEVWRQRVQNGERLLHGILHKSTASSCVAPQRLVDGGSDLLAYVAHATDRYDLRSVVSYGAYGVLYRLSSWRSSSGDDLVQEQRQQQMEDKKGLLLVRHMRLRDVPADRSETIVQEIKTLHQQQQHPPPHHHYVIAPILAYARSTDTLVFVYHLPPGSRSLAEVLRDDRGATPSLSWIQRLELLLGVAAALHVLHSTAAASVNGSTTGSTPTGHRFHGDVSSKTLYVANDPTTDDATTTCSIYLLDGPLYRLPVAADPWRCRAGDVIYGTRGYRCPRYERGSCLYDWASDMFAFGIVAAEVLTGRLQSSKQQHEHGVGGTAAWDVYYECVLSQQPLVADPMLGPPPVPEALSVLGRIIGLCLHPHVHQRPSAALVVPLLAQLVQDMRSRRCQVVTP